ncbi:hypothetical protein [Paenibacillus sp. BK033]|uniref:hypothetical protein n=1 Tax=Paenibacillus sp. BK033 TaxID=2512133 RepID=UPI0010472D15|nr:hypothetical protein [Paenibacillus sp. BK033]
MKYKIIEQIRKEKIRNLVPPKFFTSIPSSWPEICTVIKFKCDRNDVILSTTVLGAIHSLDPSDESKKIAFGSCFTIEAVELLRENNIKYIALSDFPWTDERYKFIKSNSR